VDSKKGTYELGELIGIDTVYVGIAVGLWGAAVAKDGHEGVEGFGVAGHEAGVSGWLGTLRDMQMTKGSAILPKLPRNVSGFGIRKMGRLRGWHTVDGSLIPVCGSLFWLWTNEGNFPPSRMGNVGYWE